MWVYLHYVLKHILDFENLGAEDPRCPLAGLKIPESRASKVYGEANSLDKFKV